ncbi:MAG: hypothetical protein IBX41_05105 [Methanophagales archaeon]|nr:hypothetical protein [Methanophagales archaeon]
MTRTKGKMGGLRVGELERKLSVIVASAILKMPWELTSVNIHSEQEACKSTTI